MANLVNEGGSGEFKAASIAYQDVVTGHVNNLVAGQPGLRYCGHSVKENAGTPAAARIIIKNHATQASGVDMAHINLTASQGNNVWCGDAGVECPNGIGIEWLAGSCDVTVYYKVVT